ncbi:MAG TPA: nucleotidyltransferase family protein, partial [Rhizomicrobium sp.]|nr:nucleotidyltransferase family protein [Rhizomicrobium sp.]
MIRRAMVMAAGLGVRMRPLTDDRPKPLIKVGGKTLIDHSLDRLVAAGVEMAVINLHYKGEMLRAYLKNRRDIEIRYSAEEDALLDTGGGVVKALAHFKDEPFFILNSDSIWVEGYKSALTAMNQAWDAGRMDGLLLLASMVTALGYDGWRG